MMDEEWRSIPGFDGYYEVSSLGSVRSLDRILTSGKRRKGRAVALGTGNAGHKRVRLCKGGVHHWFGVHCLVLMTFVGPRPEGMQGAHNNGKPDDNRPANLRWDTPKGNAADRRKHGTEMIGEKNPRAKLADKQVVEVFKMRSAGVKGKDIAKAMDCTPANISSILNGKHRRAA